MSDLVEAITAKLNESPEIKEVIKEIIYFDNLGVTFDGSNALISSAENMNMTLETRCEFRQALNDFIADYAGTKKEALLRKLNEKVNSVKSTGQVLFEGPLLGAGATNRIPKRGDKIKDLRKRQTNIVLGWHDDSNVVVGSNLNQNWDEAIIMNSEWFKWNEKGYWEV